MHHTHHHHSFAQDLHTLSLQFQSARRKLLIGVAALPLAACGGGSSNAAPVNNNSSAGGNAGSASCPIIPSETAGPFPGDGSNGANALALAGIVRSDISASIVSSSTLAAGVPLTLTLTLVNSNGSCVAASGLAVYLWHCDALGNYSLYSSGVTNENYLRGVQVSDAAGKLGFSTIVPGCYPGRWPHMHFEIFRTLTAATSGANSIKTTQLALPEAQCRAVYAGAGYAGSTANLNALSLARDGIFSDGASLQMATMGGDAVNGYNASLQVAVGL